MEDHFQVNKPEVAGPSVKELLFKYLKFLPFFVMSVALALLGAYLYLRYTTPKYKSESAIIIKGESGGGNSGGGGDRFSQLFVLDNAINIQNEIELLRSRQLMDRVVEKLNLNFQYYAQGKIREVHHYKDIPFFIQPINIVDSSAAFVLDIEFDDNDNFQVKGSDHKLALGAAFTLPQGQFRLVRIPGPALGEAYKIIWNPTRNLAGRLVSDLLVAPKGPNGILSISLVSTHPVLAADVLNQLMREYQVATIEDKNENKRQIIAFVDDRLKVLSKELDSVTASMLAYQLANNLVNTTSQSTTYLSRMDSYEEQITGQQVQINIANMIEAYLNDSKNNFDVVPSSLGLADVTLNTLISAYNVAQLDRKALVDANVPATNTRVQQRNSQLEQLRLNILESLRTLKNSYVAAIGRLQKISSEVRSEIQQLPLKEQNLMEIRKQQTMKQEVYNFLMEKREETAISLAATISNIKVVEEASVNKTPVSPDKRLAQIIAIALGLLLPALVIFAMEMLNDKIRSRNDIEKVTDVPVIGEVGHSFAEDTLVVKPNNRGLVAEQFRILRSNLQYVLAGIDKPVILVTSSFSGEGKSFTSTNLGAVLSLANKRTIILEFDIRKPKVLSGLGLPKKPGFTNWMLGKVQLEDLPVPVTGYDNLFVLPCGPIPPNPAEMLLNPKLEELFAWVKEHYDVVVIDTAPVGIVSDALTLSRFANATLYITRQGRTLKKQVGLIDELHHAGKLPRMSVVLNDVQLESVYGYYGYGKYGYGYGQGSGYFDEEEDLNGSANGNGLFGWLKGKKKKKSKVKV